MNAACRGSDDGPTASPSTTTKNPESVGSESTPAGGGSLGMNTDVRRQPLTPLSEWVAPDPGGTRMIALSPIVSPAFENTIAGPYASVLPPPRPAPPRTDVTQISALPAAAPQARTPEAASRASASASTPSAAPGSSGRPASGTPNATEGGAVPVGSAAGSRSNGVAAGAFVEPGARVYVVGRYLDCGHEVLAGDVPEGESFEVGRKPGTAFEHDHYVERYHAALVPMNDGVVVEDFGSQNGVFLRLVRPTPIEDGDQFRIGDELLAVRSLSRPEEAGVRALGCPDPGYWARIDMLLRPDLVAASYPVDENEALIGREEGSIQFPDDPAVSAEHCRLRADGEQILLEDLDSEHGTFLRLRPQQVVPYGSTLLVGQTLLRLERNA
jgi:pSer/pThr/pTyr-binding forkhead associated (FHA) protein